MILSLKILTDNFDSYIRQFRSYNSHQALKLALFNPINDFKV